MADQRLDDRAVAERLAWLDDALGAMESMPLAETALDAVATLTEVYGEALARIIDRADAPLAAELLADELVGHLLTLHDLNPESAEQRIRRALSRIRPDLADHGCEAELLNVTDHGARIRVKGRSQEVQEVVREAVLAAAPELTTVDVVSAFIPVEALLGAGKHP